MWDEMMPPLLGSNASTMIIDPARDRLVLFGQSSLLGYENHVWVRPLSGETPWTRLEIPGPHPPTAIAGTAIYDPVRQRMIIYGGMFADGVWALSLSGTPGWSRLAPGASGPGDRMGIVGVYDPAGDRMVVFSGYPPLVSDVWALALSDSSGWTKLSPMGTAPAARSDYAAVYDATRHRVVLFSGVNFSADVHSVPDLWALSLGDTLAWTELHAGGEGPPDLYQAAAAYDTQHDRMVVFSGVEWDVGAIDTTWVLQFGDSLTWFHMAPQVRPAPRNSPCMVYDATRDRFIMFGGGISDTWALSLSSNPAWTELQAEEQGPPLSHYLSAAAYDSTRHRTLLFGGHYQYPAEGSFWPADSGELWALTYDGFSRWTQVIRDPAAPAMYGRSLIIDPPADRLIAFGGVSGGDATFGGLLQLPLSGVDGWNTLDVSGTVPPARYLHTATYDPVHRRMIVFGGSAGGRAFADAWMLDLAGLPQWMQLDSTASAVPAARYGHTAAYDPVGDRVIVFGGIAGDGTMFGDTWQLSLAGTPAWSRLPLTTSPSPRDFASMTYDSRRQRLVLFGGRDREGNALRDTWFLPLAGGTGWIMADSSGVLPEQRWGAASVYDPDRDRVVIIYGTVNPCSVDPINWGAWDVWGLRSTDSAPAPLSVASVQAHPWHVTVEWQGAPGIAFSGTVERRTASSTWTQLGAVSPDASGLVRFDDFGASPGVRYAYRVVWSVGPSANTTEPLWVDVPELRFALARPTNPSRLGLTVAFSLPDDAAARLVVLDIAGRSVVSRAVGELGAGDHVLELAAPGALAPGVYLIRLSHGGDSRVTRVSIIH